MGTAGVFRVKVGVSWEKEARRAVKMNWERVIRRPLSGSVLEDMLVGRSTDMYARVALRQMDGLT